MSYTPTGILAKQNPSAPRHESSLYSHMTANGRDPVRDEYLRLAGRVAGTQPMTAQQISLPGMVRLLPPWKIG